MIYSLFICKFKIIENFVIFADISIKPSNIRIWIHECNIKQLAKVIWSGFGDKLLTETSKQATVNKFLKVVPNIMVKLTFKIKHFCSSKYVCLLLLLFVKGYYQRNS